MFLRYFEGAKPGKRRQESQKPATDVSQAKKAYEQKRERNFLCSWQKSRSWLVYDEPANIMYCSTCRSTSVPENDTVFVKGTNSFRLDGIKNHEISDIHVKASQKLAAKSIPISQSVGAKCLQQLKKAENDRLIILMRNAHAVAKHNLSLKSYELLCKLDKAKGLDVGSSYLNDKAAATFTESIASTTRASLIQKVNNCDYCSFTCDGSTDFTGDDMESLYLRTSTKGIIEDTFMFIGCPESASSEDIYLYIKGVFNKLKLESQIKNKLVGFCADGASNMQGNKTGLAALLRKDWPHLLVTHCLAHRLELAFKDTVKKASPKLYEKTTTLLLGLYYYYHKSPKEKKGLLRAFEMLQVKQNLPTRIGGTRWLPHYERAINVFVKAYKVLRFHLESSSHRNAKAEGLAKLLQDGNVVVYILTLKRVIDHAIKLSLFLQSDGLSLADAYSRVEATKVALNQMHLRPDNTTSSIVLEEKYQDETVIFKGRKLEFDNLRESLIESLAKSLDNRFPSSELITSTSVGSFRNWPSQGAEAIADYGDTHITTLWNHFESKLGTDHNKDEILDEWSLLKSLVYGNFSEDLKKNTLTWDVVFKSLLDPGTENILQLIDVLCAMPPTSVKNETTFSQMKLLKNKRRGRLQSDRLNDLLTIKLESPDIESFDPEPAILEWMTSTPSGQKRRPNRSVKPVQKDVIILDSNSLSDKDATISTGTEPAVQQSFELEEPVAAVWHKDKIDDDDEEEEKCDDEMEMAEETVFSLLLAFRE